MLASEVISKAAKRLHDAGAVRRFPDADHLGFLTDALRMLAELRPDLFATREVVELTAGSTRQALPSKGKSLIKVTRNMGADGETPGRIVTRTTEDSLNDALAEWNEAAESAEIEHYFYDDRDPRAFCVSPPPTADVHVEIVFVREPDPVATAGDTLPVQAVLCPALVEAHLFQAFSINNDSQADADKAKNCLANFFLLIGKAKEAEILMSPNNERNHAAG